MKMTKCLVLLLCLSMLLSLAACGNQNTPPPVEGPSNVGGNTQNQGSSNAGTPDKDKAEEGDKTSPQDQPVVFEELTAIDWTQDTSALEGYVIEKDVAVTMGNGSYHFDKTLAVTPAAGAADASAVEITYEFNQTVYNFSAMVGLADSEEGGSVEFLVYVDGALRARTGEMLPGEYMFLSCSVYRSEKMTLVVTNFDGENTGDLAVWGEPKLFTSRRLEKIEAALPMEVDYTIGDMEWNYATSLHDDTKGAPFINKNENGGKLSMGNSFFKPTHGVWMHPRGGEEEAYSEIEINLDSTPAQYFVATFGLSDEYSGSLDGLGGIVNEDSRAVEFVFLVDGEEVAVCRIINSVKLGTVVLDVSGARTLTIRVTNYNGVHNCDASVISGGFIE